MAKLVLTHFIPRREGASNQEITFKAVSTSPTAEPVSSASLERLAPTSALDASVPAFVPFDALAIRQPPALPRIAPEPNFATTREIGRLEPCSKYRLRVVKSWWLQFAYMGSGGD
jgi:hypothetical protein